MNRQFIEEGHPNGQEAYEEYSNSLAVEESRCKTKNEL